MKREKAKQSTEASETHKHSPFISMELFSSTINDTWKLCTLGGVLGLLLLAFLLTNTPQTVQISNSRSTVVAFISTDSDSDRPPSTASAAPAEAPAKETTYSSSFILSQPFNSAVVPPLEVAAAAVAPSTNPTTAAVGDVVHETPTGATTSSSDKSSSNSTTSPAPDPPSGATTSTNTTTGVIEFEIPTIDNSTDVIQSLNSSTLEEKLFGTSLEVDSSAVATGTAAAPGPTSGVNESNNSGSGGGGGGEKRCNIYEGRWVYKPEENPRYRVHQCPFLEEKMSCQRNGRPDFEYEGWSWESNDCQIPLFNGKDMLERLRGKRMIIAGDSLNRNQWESLACLLYTSVASHRVLVDAGSPAYKVLKAKDYDFTLEFYWAPFLVNFNENHKSGRKVVVLDELVPSSKQWRGADVMVFNSGHWWTHNGKFKAWDTFEYGGEQVQEMQTEIAYERALATWTKWLALNVDPTKTKVFFRSISPEHKNKQWCFNASRPIADESYNQIYPRSMIDLIEGKIREMNGRDGVHVRYINITKLSSYRQDAHPSIYRFKHWKVITEKYKRLLKSRSDCSHWCLPGLPDTWNRVLYASLFFDHLNPGELSSL